MSVYMFLAEPVFSKEQAIQGALVLSRLSLEVEHKVLLNLPDIIDELLLVLDIEHVSPLRARLWTRTTIARRRGAAIFGALRQAFLLQLQDLQNLQRDLEQDLEDSVGGLDWSYEERQAWEER